MQTAAKPQMLWKFQQFWAILTVLNTVITVAGAKGVVSDMHTFAHALFELP